MSIVRQTPSQKNLLFEVHTIEWLKKNGRLPDSPCQHGHYQVLWCTRGMGRYCIDLESYLLADNSVFFIPPGRMQQLKADGEIDGYVLSFNANFLFLATVGPGNSLHSELLTGFPKVRVFSLGENRVEGFLTNVVQDMIRELEQHLLLSQEILSGLLNIFLIYMRRMSVSAQQEDAPSRRVDLFNSFCSKVERDFLTKRLVADYASELSVTPNYLSDVVKRVTGFTASYHIQQRMVLEAKRLAMYSDANMKLIAYKLGFDDLSHFSKFFKNVAGVNFSEFRSKSRLIPQMPVFVNGC